MRDGKLDDRKRGQSVASLTAWRIVIIYAVCAGLWILLSDKALAKFLVDPETITQLSIYKGWFFVAVTSLLLFGRIRYVVAVLERSYDAFRAKDVALRESESRLEEAQHIAGVGSYELDLTTGIWTSTAVCDHVLGIGASYNRTVAGWASLVHPDERVQMQDYFQNEVLGRQQTFDKQYRIVRPADGAVRWVHGNGLLTFSEAGAAISMRGTIQDIHDRKMAELAIGTAKRSLQATLDALPDLLFEVDRKGRIYNYHSHRDDLLAAPPSMCLDKCFCEILPPDVSDICFKAMAEADRDGLSTGLVYALQLPQGKRWFEISVSTIHEAEEQHKRFIFIARDITERKSAQDQLLLAARVFSHAREGIFITDPQGAILNVNDAFTRITGFLPEDAIGQNPRILKSGRQGRDFYAAMWQKLTEQGYWSGELWNRQKNGEIFAAMTTISAVRDAMHNTLQYVCLFTDISATKKYQEQLEHIAHFDALTSLPNRVLLADRMRQTMLHAQRHGGFVAVAYIDLDGFKAINDQYGHAIGDQVLIVLARAMQATLRESDTLARIGGDEFVALLTDLNDEPGAVPLLERLLEAASAPVQLDNFSHKVSASVGVSFYPQLENIDADQLLRQADQAMYQVKVSGKAHYHIFDTRQDSSIRGHHEDLERIRLALAQREFVLVYQPKVNMRTGRVIGAEALIRWQHPELGLLQPAVFLPVIERSTLTIELGEWVIDTALSQVERWMADGLDLPVSVNASALELQHGNFVERLQRILARHPGVNPAKLQIEVLETSALMDMPQASQVIDDCAKLGVMFALDDFGTGYSSLTYLKRLRVKVLKIDQSFVRDLLDEPDDLPILQGVIGMATAFQLEVIAEGVETVAHGAELIRLGCELAQGYGIARPMPGADMLAWTKAWQPDAAWSREGRSSERIASLC